MFNQEQYLLLLYFLLAHLVADFMLQTQKMVANKRWFSGQMALHIGIVFITALLFTGKPLWAAIAAAIHYLIDGMKTHAEKKGWGNNLQRFLADQVLHIITILFIWAINTTSVNSLWNLIKKQYLGPEGALILLGYIIVLWPVAYVIKFTTAGLSENSVNETENQDGEKTLEKGGKLIGQYERLIILTLVLLGEYQAIGFLITGKSILRFSDRNGKYFSEYVLVGTMMSYALAILVGIGVNLVLKGL